ncbi:hypothetical protein [Mesorhizobium sp. P5_C1]
MAKMSIYVSDELKERMDGRPNDNWSSIAQRAFELQINSTLKEGTDMTEVIERLRASKAKLEERERPQWTKDGREWAAGHAEIDELTRVCEIDVDAYDDADDLLLVLCAAYNDDPNPDRDQVADICEQLTGSPKKRPTRNQLAWYIEGAQQVWEEVKDEVFK